MRALGRLERSVYAALPLGVAIMLDEVTYGVRARVDDIADALAARVAQRLAPAIAAALETHAGRRGDSASAHAAAITAPTQSVVESLAPRGVRRVDLAVVTERMSAPPCMQPANESRAMTSTSVPPTLRSGELSSSFPGGRS